MKKSDELREFLKSQPGGGRQLDYPKLEPFLTAPVMQELAAGKPGKKLSNLGHRVRTVWLFDFWSRVFHHAGKLPAEEVQRIWYDCFNDRGVREKQEIVLPGSGQVRIGNRTPLPKELAEHALTDGLLIDNDAVRHRYCQLKKPGWKILRYTDGKGRRTQCRDLPEETRQAIMRSSFPGFCISLDMRGRKVSFALLKEVLWSPYEEDDRIYAVSGPWHPDPEVYPVPEKQAEMLREMLQDGRMPPEKELPMTELIVYLAANFPDCLAVPYLQAVEEHSPGAIKSWRDDFGRNLLWYTLYNQFTGWFHPDCRLVPLLLDLGCDPDNRNQLGLSWLDVTDRLTGNQKQSLMKNRYRCHHYTWGKLLQREQPLDKIQ